MKVKFLTPWSNGTPNVFQIGSTLEVDNALGRALVAEGTAVEMPEDTPSRIDPTGYDGCNPPSARGALEPVCADNQSEDAPTEGPQETRGAKRPAKA